MTILIITHSGENPCVETVSSALRAAGRNVFRFDTDDYPGASHLTLGFGEGIETPHLTTRAGSLALDQVEAIWYRRLRVGQGLDKTIDSEFLEPAIEESRRTLHGFLATTAPFVLDPLPRIRYAENKQIQLEVAQSFGLEVPDSLFSNNPDAVRAFASVHDLNIVTKMQSSFAMTGGGEERVVFTNKLSREDLAELDGLRLCPMIFQELIPKQLELRVTIVGNELFCCAIDSALASGGAFDWRRAGAGLAQHWIPHTLPTDICTRLLKVMDHFTLNYGAVDIILTPDGRYVFLEINPCGEFYWLEDCLGFHICKAIANLLLGRAQRRVRNIFATTLSNQQRINNQDNCPDRHSLGKQTWS